MKKSVIFANILATGICFGFSFCASAQEVPPAAAMKPVSFSVTIGQLQCAGSKGEAVVKFGNTPTEGGYYEVYGKPIEENSIALSREVPLPPGAYSWKAVANDGYEITGNASGEFVIPVCPLAPAKKPQQDISVSAPQIEISGKQPISAQTEIAATSSSSANDLGSAPVVIAALVLAGAVLALFGFRSGEKGKTETAEKK